MNRATEIVIAAAFLLAGGLAAPSPAVEPRYWTTGWSLGAEVTQPVLSENRIVLQLELRE